MLIKKAQAQGTEARRINLLLLSLETELANSYSKKHILWELATAITLIIRRETKKKVGCTSVKNPSAYGCATPSHVSQVTKLRELDVIQSSFSGCYGCGTKILDRLFTSYTNPSFPSRLTPALKVTIIFFSTSISHHIQALSFVFFWTHNTMNYGH